MKFILLAAISITVGGSTGHWLHRTGPVYKVHTESEERYPYLELDFRVKTSFVKLVFHIEEVPTSGYINAAKFVVVLYSLVEAG
jgi:hypothetical protein